LVNQGRLEKNYTLKGSKASIPIGLYESRDFPALAVCEGGPDFIACFGHLHASAAESRVAPICMASAGIKLAESHLVYFQKKAVTIFGHADPEGRRDDSEWRSSSRGGTRDSSFSIAPAFQKQPTAPIFYYVFDVLWSAGADVTNKRIMERRRILERVLKSTAGVQVGTYIDGEGRALFDLTKEKGMEGIIAKKERPYLSAG
jgi:hypothetical protein